MKRFILLLFLISITQWIASQKVERIEAESIEDKIRVTFTLYTDAYQNLSLMYSENNGLNFIPCRNITGDIYNQLSGEKQIVWDYAKDGIIMGNLIFKVIFETSTTPPKEEETILAKDDEKKNLPKQETKIAKEATTKGSFLIMPGIAIGNEISYSLMAGYVNKWGGYAKLKSNFVAKKSYEIGNETDAYYNGNTRTGRYSILAGVIRNLNNSIFLYGGLGYGSKWTQWETISSQQVEIENLSYFGVEPELGIIFKFKNFGIGGGVNLLSGKGHTNIEMNISIGIIF